MKCLMVKGGNTLVPGDDAAREIVGKIKPGHGVWVDVKRPRNLPFHKKFFALLNLGFDHWEPEEKQYKGQPIQKDIRRFRGDTLILAGHYDAVFDINGNVKLTPKSISFASCDEDEFNRVYQSVLNVLWDRILRQANYKDKDEVENVVNQLMSFT